ncbi:unnamed protein product [Heligmosomoides polygyrus]|uniref:DUF5641 domain-containing protein n=1 Tax=Heligmosomoides polygyrus TaxID=6339 RepID=A0A183FF96_HELPZ|nr:unnamed protein product [Heligmosomoides polygyrus]
MLSGSQSSQNNSTKERQVMCTSNLSKEAELWDTYWKMDSDAELDSVVIIRPIDFIQKNMIISSSCDPQEETNYLSTQEASKLRTKSQANEALKDSVQRVDKFWAAWQDYYLKELREFHKKNLQEGNLPPKLQARGGRARIKLDIPTKLVKAGKDLGCREVRRWSNKRSRTSGRRRRYYKKTAEPVNPPRDSTVRRYFTRRRNTMAGEDLKKCVPVSHDEEEEDLLDLRDFDEEEEKEDSPTDEPEGQESEEGDETDKPPVDEPEETEEKEKARPLTRNDLVSFGVRTLKLVENIGIDNRCSWRN